MSSPLPVAVIGAGHMGRHHVRKYAELPGTRLVAVIDADVERARALAEPLGAKWAAEYSPQLGELAAVTVAVPTTHHLPVARWAEPAEFERWKRIGEDLGIGHVEASPLTRSSYHAKQAAAHLQVARASR